MLLGQMLDSLSTCACASAGWILVILYSVTAPVGIAIGIGIAEGYDPDSTRANAVQVRGESTGLPEVACLMKDVGVSLQLLNLSLP